MDANENPQMTPCALCAERRADVDQLIALPIVPYLSVESPMAWASILLENNIGPRSSSGTIIGQGNLVEAKAMLKKAGNTIAASQSMVFHFNRFFFSMLFIAAFSSVAV